MPRYELLNDKREVIETVVTVAESAEDKRLAAAAADPAGRVRAAKPARKG